MNGGTPTATAMVGTIAYAKSYVTQAGNETHRAVVVLATDGVPDESCGGEGSSSMRNTIANVVTIATGAANSTPAVRTFVIGVGKELGPLDAIAVAGGTSKALLVDTSGNADLQFLAALTQIRRDALGCDFALPQMSGVDQSMARVSFAPDNGGPTIDVPAVDGLDSCAQGQGWFFGAVGSTTKLVLCPTTCDTVTQGVTGDLRVEFACSIQ